MKDAHPAVAKVLETRDLGPAIGLEDALSVSEMTTSLSLAQALAVGCLSRLEPDRREIRIWDPTVGSGFAGSVLVRALQASGVNVHYRGQDFSEEAVIASRDRFSGNPTAEFAVGNTLEVDRFPDYVADLAIVDGPWNVDWRSSRDAVEARREAGEFRWGVPEVSDSTWLFISLALEKLRAAGEGGGRVAALVSPASLAMRTSEAVRRRLLESGLLESVTQLAEGLTPGSRIPLYLLTFTNDPRHTRGGRVMVSDMRGQFTTEGQARSITRETLMEVESGLRRWKPGPRTRIAHGRMLSRNEASASRMTSSGQLLKWNVVTSGGPRIDDRLLSERYGSGAGVVMAGAQENFVDFSPSLVFDDGAKKLVSAIHANSWPDRRLTALLEGNPERYVEERTEAAEVDDGELFIPTSRDGEVTTTEPATKGRMLRVRVGGAREQRDFLVAWLNSDQGRASRWRAIEAASSGSHVRAVRTDPSSLMRWADELIVPVPDEMTQRRLSSADQRLASFQAELSSQREAIWTSPEQVGVVLNQYAPAFDDSLPAWFEQLPYPMASALWTAETAASPGEQLEAYHHAWEALVIFHASVLLSAVRRQPGGSSALEAEIRKTLQGNGLSIARASFGTWVAILEKTSKSVRRALVDGDGDDAARMAFAFGGLPQVFIQRIASNELVQEFKAVSSLRNAWQGHGGHTSSREKLERVNVLVSHLHQIRRILGSAWSQLVLVRANRNSRDRTGFNQTVELATGTRSRFRSTILRLPEALIDGDLYLLHEGSESPLPLCRFVQLRAAPPGEDYTSYFYNRTEGSKARLVTYQFASASEMMVNSDFLEEASGGLGET